jgi:hypothetical protein
LRLAKRNKHTLPILKKHQAVQDTFLPLLTPDNGEELVVHTELVRIQANVLARLQAEQVEGHTKRGSVLDLDETHGTLLEDLSADPSVLLLDFKVPPVHDVSKNSPNGCRSLPPHQRMRIPVEHAHYDDFARNNRKQSPGSVLWIYHRGGVSEYKERSLPSSRKNQSRITYSLA